MSTRGAAFLLIVGAALGFRLPAILNARALSSDAAVVGLQAMHILRGEWSWFIWKAGYQSSFDALMAAVVFALTGPSAGSLIAAPLAGYILLIALVFDCLRRRLPVWTATIATLVLAFTPAAVTGVTLFPPRQWCLTCIAAAVWLIDGASASRRPLVRYAAGAFAGALSLYLDVFSLQIVPALAVLTFAATLDGAPTHEDRRRRLTAAAAGAVMALIAVGVLHLSPEASFDGGGLAPDRWRENLRLLGRDALAWILGYSVFVPGPNLYPDRWTPPAVVRVIQMLGALSLMAGIIAGGAAIRADRIPWEVRRLGVFGFVTTATALVGFVASSRPVDMWAARYLSPIIWTAPFALAPAACLLGPRRFGLALAPYLVVAAVGGWVSYGPLVRGFAPAIEARGRAHDEDELASVLRQRGVTHAAAQYWLSYRLTFLFRENPIVVPLDENDDRYAPYRNGLERAAVVAYIFHPSEPRAMPGPYEAAFRDAHEPYERLEVRGFTVIVRRR